MSISDFISELSPSIPALPLVSESPRTAFPSELNLSLQGSAQVERISACATSVFSGLVASIVTRNPFPLLIGFCRCLPTASAQQKIGNEFRVNTYTTNSQWYPSVASFSNGNFVVTWHTWLLDGSSNGVFGQLFDENGTKIGGEFQANTYIIFSQEYPSVASFSNGNFVVTWMSDGQDGSSYGIFGQLFDGNGTKIGNEFQANSYTTDWQRFSSVASLSNGNFVVTWQSNLQDGSADGIYGQLFDGNGIIIGSEFRANTYTTNNQRSSSVASFSNGNFVVTWWSDGRNGSDPEVYVQLFNGNATKIGSEFRVNNYTTFYQEIPSVASFSNGNFVVTWQSGGDGSNYGVFGQLFDGYGTKIGSEFRANSYTNNAQNYPSAASLSNGNFVVTWQSHDQDGSRDGVYGQLFDGNATKIGGEFRANTYTNSDQSRPSVASLANGNFVTSWQSRNQDGSGDGIYGQIFDGFPVSSTTSTTASSTTSSLSSSPITTSNSRTTFSATPDSTKFFSWIWFLLGGVGAVSCLSLTGYYLFKSRGRKNDDPVYASELGEASEEIVGSTRAFELKPVVQRHKVIGKAYQLLSTLEREEAQEIYLQTGHLIPFPEGQKKFPYVIDSGHLEKIIVARRIENERYVAAKKVKGKENIHSAEAAADMQKVASGENVLPIYDTFRLEDSLYYFMPLAGLGNGLTIQRRLALLNQSPFALRILTFIAQNILTGLQTIHTKGIGHLDMKPDHLVFTKDGTAYIIGFGCAKKLTDTCLPGKVLEDNRYFSPERLQSCREGSFDAAKADMWAAGVTLLQIFYNKEPLELFQMPQGLSAIVENCDRAHFDEQLQRFFSEVEEGSIWWVIKGLLDTNPKTRLTATQALQAGCFHGLDKTQQEQAFEDFRRETFAKLRGVETRQVNLHDYEWVLKEALEERAQAHSSEQNQQLHGSSSSGYQLTPDHVSASSSASGYQLTPDHVTASSSASGYQLTPDHVTASSSSSGYQLTPDHVTASSSSRGKGGTPLKKF